MLRWTMMSRVRRTLSADPLVRGYANATAPKLKPHAPPAAADYGGHPPHHHPSEAGKKKRWMAGEFMPVYVALGMITLSVTLGVYTAKEQIMHAPNVRVRKRERERVGEVVDPDRVAGEGDKFVKGSFFRKVAHVQEFDTGLTNNRDRAHSAGRKDAFAYGTGKGSD